MGWETDVIVLRDAPENCECYCARYGACWCFCCEDWEDEDSCFMDEWYSWEEPPPYRDDLDDEEEEFE